jgi:hypothetical protein
MNTMRIASELKALLATTFCASSGRSKLVLVAIQPDFPIEVVSPAKVARGSADTSKVTLGPKEFPIKWNDDHCDDPRPKRNSPDPWIIMLTPLANGVRKDALDSWQRPSSGAAQKLPNRGQWPGQSAS